MFDNPFAFIRATTTFHFGTGRSFTSHVSANTPFADRVERTEMTLFPTGDPPDQKTGEEDDEVLLDVSVNLYRLRVDEDTGERGYVERGSGQLHLNRSNGFHRVVVRQVTGNVILNTRVFSGMNPRIVSGRRVRFLASPAVSQGISQSEGLSVMLASFKTNEDAERFVKAVEEACL